MQVASNGFTIDALAIVTGDHLLTALAQICFYDQTTLAWLHEWSEGMIRTHKEHALEHAVFVAFNALVCSYIDESEG